MLSARQIEALPALGLVDVQLGYGLGPLTRLGIGGPADLLAVVPTPEVLTTVTRWTRRERLALTPLQQDTDVLIRAGGIRGLVVVLGVSWRSVGKRSEGLVLGGELAAQAAVEQLGEESPAWLRGARGSVANALVAGDPHSAEGVRSVEFVLGRGVIQHLPIEELSPSSPRLGLRDEAVIAHVTLLPSFAPDPAHILPARLPGVRMFRDPPKGSSAAELLGRSGLLGVRVRGAQIDEEHPNQMHVEEGATAHDVLLLVDWARSKVAAESGVELELAIRTLGSRP